MKVMWLFDCVAADFFGGFSVCTSMEVDVGASVCAAFSILGGGLGGVVASTEGLEVVEGADVAAGNCAGIVGREGGVAERAVGPPLAWAILFCKISSRVMQFLAQEWCPSPQLGHLALVGSPS